MNETFEMITVNADNLDKQGFFCYMSKLKSPGYRQKHAWMAARLAEGLKLHMIHEIGGRTVGFIEYIPGEVAWRAVHAPGYLLIHCLWVVGKGKGKGYGAHLIQTCLDDARAQDKHGVVTVATERVWMANPPGRLSWRATIRWPSCRARARWSVCCSSPWPDCCFRS